MITVLNQKFLENTKTEWHSDYVSFLLESKAMLSGRQAIFSTAVVQSNYRLPESEAEQQLVNKLMRRTSVLMNKLKRLACTYVTIE